MKMVTLILVLIVLAVFVSLPGTARADYFTLIDVDGVHWENNPPTPGPIDRIDTFIMAGDYVFTGTGANYFSNTGSTTWTATLKDNLWSQATSPTPFKGNMSWNYDFAGTYTPGTLITLALNYYNGNTFVIAEEWTVGSSGYSGDTYTTPFVPDPPAAPLPASALLLGTGILGMGLLGRRRKNS
jgi:hypothetical protein